MSRRPLLGVVHPESGEIQECPRCKHREDILVQYEMDFRVLKAKITKLERDEEAAARTDPLWDEAEALHTWWRLAAWYPQTEFDADDFWLVKKHLKRIGLIGCLKVVCGAAYDPYVSTSKNGREKAHNGWDLIFKDKPKSEDFSARVPFPDDPDAWKRWLIAHIESRFL